MVCVTKRLVIIQFSVMDVNHGYTRNVVVLMVDFKLIPSIDVKYILDFADR